MPRIPIYTAEGKPVGVPGTPSDIRVGRPLWGDVFKDVGEASIEGGRISQGLQNIKDKSDFEALKTNFDVRMKNIMIDAERDPSIYQSPEAYMDVVAAAGEKEFRNFDQTHTGNIIAGLHVSDNATRAYQAHVAKQWPELLTAARNHGKKLFAENEMKKYELQKGIYAKRAGEAYSETERDATIAEFNDYIQQFRDLNLMGPGEVALEKQKFMVEATTAQMEATAQRNPTEMFANDQKGEYADVPQNKRHQIREKTRTEMQQAEDRALVLHNRMKDRVLELWISMQSTGSLPQSMIDDAKAFNNPFVDPSDAIRVEELGKRLRAKNDARPVNLLRNQYLMEPGYATQPVIERYRSKLSNLMMQNPDADLTAFNSFANELRSDYLAVEGRQENNRFREAYLKALQGREERTDIQQRTQRALQLYDELPKSPSMGGMIGSMQKNREEMEKAEIKRRVNEGEDPDKLIEEIQKRKKQRQDNRSDAQKKADEIRKNLGR